MENSAFKDQHHELMHYPVDVTGSTINHDSDEEDVIVGIADMSSPNDERQITIASSGAFREECIHLISYNNDTRKFQVSNEAKEMLKRVKGPLGVIAVAGMYRTGKSFLLNRMLLNRQKGGFGVGPSINPCTKGLWLWGTPVAGTTPDGEPVNVLVVDSEGIGGLDEDNNHDTRIFSLALLLSSYFLYNSVGSIDENALSSLSLVVNITKHIQLKSCSPKQHKEGEEDEAGTQEEEDDISSYLPRFMWVVRDFALQLVDEHGDKLTSKEYLERALNERGATDDQKNEVRRALKRYFKERECCTMIRPLTNEEELQNLDSRPMEDLRKEFVDQVHVLRSAVLHNIKPKSIHGHLMNGNEWIQLVEIYVKAINEGAVPSIQSAWTSICRQAANKALDQAKATFEQELGSFVVHLPMNQEDLEGFLRDQIQALTEEILAPRAKGDPEVFQECVNQLNLYLGSRSAEVLNENRNACRRYASDLLGQLFNELSQQLGQQVLPNGLVDLSQLDSALQEVSMIYDQNALDFNPQGGSEKALLLAEARAIFLQDLLHQVSNQLAGEVSLLKTIDHHSKERLEQQLREAKEEARLERHRVEERVKSLLLERSELEAQALLAKEQLESVKGAREEETRDLRAELQQLREHTGAQGDVLKQAKEDLEERVQDLQREKLQVKSEFEKERALFDQKVEFLEKSLQEKADRERGYLTELHTKRSELTGELKATCQKYETEIKMLQSDLEEERERLSEAESLILQRQGEIEASQGRWNAQELSYKQMITSTQDQLKTMEQTLSALRRDQDAKAVNATAHEKVEQLQQQLNDLQEHYKESTETAQTREHELTKDKALKEQKIQFLEVQLQDAKRQLEESHRQHEHMVKALRSGTMNTEKLYGDEETPELRAARLQSELVRMSEEHQFEMAESQSEMESLLERVHELELQAKMGEVDFNSETQDLCEQVNDLQLQRVSLLERVKILESQRQHAISESEQKYTNSLSRFEQDLELATQASQEELREAQTRSEEALTQLRVFYEHEKEKLELRIAEERDRNSKRIASAHEEIEQRLREELNERDEEIECLQNEIRETEQRHQAYLNQVDHELSLKMQLIESLERQVRESRDRSETLEQGRNTAFERQLEHFEHQRQEYNQKIDKLQMDGLDKDRQVAQMQLKMERQTDDIDRKKLEFEQAKANFEKERKALVDKLEGTKKKLNDTQDEAMRQKLDFGREQALAKQQIEFQNKKIEELQKQMDDSQKFFDEKIKIFKVEIQEEAQAQVERITSEKELWENKYEQKRKALKEYEQSYSRANTELEKRAASLQQQVDRLETEKRQLDDTYSEQVCNLQDQLQTLDSNAGAAFYYGSAAHAEDVMKLRGQVQDTERELSDLQCAYDRDKALWEGKCQFLEQQKETYKRDLLESQRKFEITLEQLQKRGSLDKDKQESSQKALMSVLDSKYQAKIREMMDTHTNVVNEAQAKVRRLETEVKSMQEKLLMEQRGKQSEQGSLDKRRLNELQDSEKRLSQEIEELKQERDRRVQDFHRQLDKEKETYRSRLAEQEIKAKESEKGRNQNMFEHEKERARWQLEKDILSCKVQELEEHVEKLVLQKENLMKENTRMKVETKSSKQRIHQQTPSYTSTSNSGMFPTTTVSGGNTTNGGTTLQQFHQHHLLVPQASTVSASSNQSINFQNQSMNAGSSRYGNMMGQSISTKPGMMLIGTIASNNQPIVKMKENSRPLMMPAQQHTPQSHLGMNQSMLLEAAEPLQFQPQTVTSLQQQQLQQQQHKLQHNMTAPLALNRQYSRFASNLYQGGTGGPGSNNGV